MKETLATLIRKHALANALAHGEAQTGSVAGKVISESSEAKKDVPLLMKLVREEVEKVNSLSKLELEKEISKYSFAERKVEEKKLTLPGVETGAVVTRFAPEPNGYPHIGHAKSAWLSRQLASDWNGKCFLRFDDTNPEAEKQEFVDAIESDLKWLGIAFNGKTQFASDHMKELYSYGEKMLREGRAYICICSEGEVKRSRETGKECTCRKKTPERNLSEWKEGTLKGFKQGEAIVRFKGDLKSLNTAMRDPTIFRILEARHYRQGSKYRVWPTYDFEAAIVDSLSGITHALRSKEYELRDELYFAILDAAGLRKPVLYDFSRLALQGTALSKRLVKPLIESGKVTGWDDPRLPTLAGLRRRGLQPEVIREFVLSFGLSKVESRPNWEALLSLNRKALDGKSVRRFFVVNPVKVTLAGGKERRISIRNHPHNEELGSRAIVVRDAVFVQEGDVAGFTEGGLVRLKELALVEVRKEKGKWVAQLVADQSGKAPIVQWVPSHEGGFVKGTILKPGNLLDENEEFNEKSLEILAGACESSCEKLGEGDIVQFERIGFVRLDDAKSMSFIYSC